MRRKTAFSLIEASIVILIVGILIGGVVLSSNLIKKSRIANARVLTEKSPILSVEGLSFWVETSFSERLVGEGGNGDEVEDGTNLSGWGESRKSVDVVEVESVGDGPVLSNTINYVPTVKFSGSAANYLRIKDASFLDGTDYTIVVLEKRTKEGGSNFVIGDLSDSSSNASLLLGYNAESQIVHSQSGLSGVGEGVSASVADYSSSKELARTLVFVHSGTEGNSLYVNGILAGRNEDAKDHLSGVGALAIGKGYDGEIGEIAIFTRALNNTERKSIEDYLGSKWKSKIFRNTSADVNGGAGADVINCVGYTVTKDGCELNCAVNVEGVSHAPVDNNSSGSLSCNQDGFEGSVSYTCSSGILSVNGSCGCEEGYAALNGQCLQKCSISVPGITATSVDPTLVSVTLNCDTANNYQGSISYTCSGGGISVTGSCAKVCNVSNVFGVADQTVSAASGTLSCGQSNTNPSATIGYTCTNGVLATTGTCACAEGYVNVNGSCQQGCAVNITGASTTIVSSGTGSFTCDQSGYSGSIFYTCSNNTLTTDYACRISTGAALCTGITPDTSTVPGQAIYRFTSSGSLVCPERISSLRYLIVGGGGGGGAFNGGGGAGGLLTGTMALEAGTYPVVVGLGGNGETNADSGGSNGGSSSFNGLTAIGGGKGSHSQAASSGGSGGGSGYGSTTRASGTSGQGNRGGAGFSQSNGWAGGGGGGAGSEGGNGSFGVGGAAGTGIISDITGQNQYYAVGAPGASYNSSATLLTAGTPALGGPSINSNPIANTGNGGATTSTTWLGKNGASGVVILRYSNGSSSCPSGYTLSGSNCIKSCSVSVAGVSSPTAVATGSGSLTCNASGYSGSSVSYTCSNGNLSTTGSCSCGTNRTGANCASCVAGYDIASGCTTCSSGYTMISGVCRQQCSINSVTGIASGTKVDHGSTSRTCDSGYTGTINYTCSNGTFTYGSGSCTLIQDCTGGSTTTVSGQKLHTFTFTTSGADQIFNCPSSKTIRYLIVAGGGGGGFDGAGGGGGGGVLTGTITIAAGNNTVRVGGGGANATAVGTQASNGENSFLVTSQGTLTAIGGGGGGSKAALGRSGGSGGGSGHNASGTAASGTSGQGNSGASNSGSGGGGGGGAGGAGTIGPAGAGGAGILSDISGNTTVRYGGGGGGGSHDGLGSGTAGSGGGGRGGLGKVTQATAGTDGLGGGGGGAGEALSNPGRKGGSGVVMIRY